VSTQTSPLTLAPGVTLEPAPHEVALPRRGRTMPWHRRAAWHLTAAASRSWGFARLVGLLDRLDSRSEHLLVSLMYHRVDEPERRPALDPGLISARPADFERQMAYLARRRPLLSLDDVLAIRRGERSMPAGAVMVTFDDGYRDFLEHAWPVLERYEIPATLFLPTAYPGRPDQTFWWDRLQAALVSTPLDEAIATPAGRIDLSSRVGRREARRIVRDWVWSTPHEVAMAGVDELLDTLGAPPCENPVLDWPELRELSAKGASIAPQTLTHPMLNRMPLEAARDEILGSVEDLRREIGSAPPAFAFPAGGYDEQLVSWLGEAGFELAFTTERGGNDIREGNWLQLRRVNVGCRSSVALVRAQLLTRVARPGSAAQAVLARK
jgi:peptidoglycan/xylan/chitin deacetylase (PgdA/CDA1 family)